MTFAPERNRLSQQGLLGQPEENEPRNLRKGRPRNYVGQISQGPTIQIGDGGIPAIDMVAPSYFFYEDHWIPAILSATTLLSGRADYRGGLLPRSEILRYALLRL